MNPHRLTFRFPSGSSISMDCQTYQRMTPAQVNAMLYGIGEREPAAQQATGRNPSALAEATRRGWRVVK